jgi:hypothetical protein
MLCSWRMIGVFVIVCLICGCLLLPTSSIYATDCGMRNRECLGSID